MRLFFLSSPGLPLVKTFIKGANGTISSKPYPHASSFTSHEVDAPDLNSFAAAVKTHASLGHCLLKGVVEHPLQSASRAGATDRDAMTDWVCFDLDGADFKNPSAFMAAIGQANVAHVLQWSASHGMPGKTGLHCHLFAQLERPYPPAVLKNWLKQLNLTVPELVTGLELTVTGVALKWPLDITTCQNDKLLFIAAPNLEGIKDPCNNSSRPRVSHVRCVNPYLNFGGEHPWSVADLRLAQNEVIQRLRTAMNLPKRKSAPYLMGKGGVEYLAKPGAGTLTVCGEDNGFVRLNLNGGDSGSYYHPVGNAEYIRTFKDDVVYLTKELDPDYYKRAIPQATQGTAIVEDTDTGSKVHYFAFRQKRDAQYYNGSYDETTRKLEFDRAANKDQLKDFMAQNGCVLGDIVLDWTVVFDPHNPLVLDPVNRVLNRFQKSEIMKGEPDPQQTDCPRRAAVLIANVLGDDAATVDHFHNWMAWITQNLDRTETGWVWSGTQGTGKNKLFEAFLDPIFGHENVSQQQMNALDDQFNEFMENKFLVLIDEIHTPSASRGSTANLNNKLKVLMTGRSLSIRKMYAAGKPTVSYSNMIFSSNQKDPVDIPDDDRRHNVGFYQEKMLKEVMNATDIDTIGDEAPALWSYWMQYPASRERARTALDTPARRNLQALSTTAGDNVATALNAGDLRYFVESMAPKKEPTQGAPSYTRERDLAAQAYRELITGIVLSKPLRKSLSLPELHILYAFLVSRGIAEEQEKFKQYLLHRGVKVELVNVQGKGTHNGVRTLWKVDPTWHEATKLELS